MAGGKSGASLWLVLSLVVLCLFCSNFVYAEEAAASVEGNEEVIPDSQECPPDTSAELQQLLEEEKQKLAASEKAKHILDVEFEQVKKESASLLEERDTMTETNAKIQAEVEQLKKKISKQTAELNSVNEKLEKKNEELKSKEENKEENEELKSKFELKVDSLETQLREKNAETEKLNKIVSELKEAMDSVKSKESNEGVLNARIEELEKKMKVDVSECRAEASTLHEELKFHRQGVHVVALHRAAEHFSAAKEASVLFYTETAKPKAEEAYKEALALYGKISVLYVEQIKPKINEAIKKAEPHTEKARILYAEKVEPVFKEHVEPHVEIGIQKAADLIEEAKAKANLAFEEGTVLYQVFRERGIRTLQRNEAFAPNAEVIFDGCINGILGLTALLLFGPMVRFVFALCKFIVFLPFRVLGCIFCCRCGSSKPKVAAKPAPVAKPKAAPANKKGGKKKKN